MSRFTKVLVLLAMSVAFTGLSVGCNTMKGAGKDIERAGDKIEDAADKAAD